MARHWFVILSVLFVLKFAERSDAGGFLSASETQRISFEMAAMEYTNPAYLGPGAYVRVLRKSRKSLPTLNAFFPFLVDFEGDVLTTYQVYQRVDNKWKETMFRGQADMCDSLKSKVKLYRIMYDYSNFPNHCPVLKGNYTVTDFKIESTKERPLPLLPASEGKVRLAWTHKGVLFMTFWFEVKLSH